MGFKQDLIEGEEAERKYIAHLATLQIKAWSNTSETLAEKRLYDIVDSDSHTYEVKCDRKWEQTGNVYFEQKTLFRSCAETIVYILKGDESFYEINRLWLLTKLTEGDYKQVKGGDKWEAGYLMPIEDFRRIFETIN